MLIFDLRVIGNKLLFFRKRKGLTQAEVAEAAEISERTYADIERGSVNMRVETVLSICKVLQITPDDILTEEPESNRIDEAEMMERLCGLSGKNKETAFAILLAYLNSME